MPQYSKDMRLYRAALRKEMELAAWTDAPYWSDHMGFIGSPGRYPQSISVGRAMTRTLTPTGKPIEVLTNFMHEGGVTMDIPVIYPLVGKGTYGDSPLLGKAEGRRIAYKTSAINQVRKAVKVKDGNMSEQVLQKPEIQRQLMKTSQSELLDWFQRWVGFAPYDALLRRYSSNILAPVVDGGLGATAQSHPNFYVAGTGKVAWSDTPATYESNIATALAGLTDATTDKFSTATIENARYLASRKKIRPVKFGKNSFYVMVISDAQAQQLWADEKWLAAQHERINSKGDDAAAFTGIIEGIYRGVMVQVDANIPDAKVTGDSGYDASRGTVNYGNDNPLEDPISTGNRKLAVLFGASAITCGYADPLSYEDEVYDFKAKKDEAGSMKIGFERGDIYDFDGFHGTAGKFLENTSSLVIATYSPEIAGL